MPTPLVKWLYINHILDPCNEFAFNNIITPFPVNCHQLKRSPTTTPIPDDDDEDLDDEDSVENESDGKIYKNPRNSPSPLCPRDEEQATLLVCIKQIFKDEVVCYTKIEKELYTLV